MSEPWRPDHRTAPEGLESCETSEGECGERIVAIGGKGGVGSRCVRQLGIALAKEERRWCWSSRPGRANLVCLVPAPGDAL